MKRVYETGILDTKAVEAIQEVQAGTSVIASWQPCGKCSRPRQDQAAPVQQGAEALHEGVNAAGVPPLHHVVRNLAPDRLSMRMHEIRRFVCMWRSMTDDCVFGCFDLIDEKAVPNPVDASMADRKDVHRAARF